MDIIAFDEEIISTENLQVPHPLMQNRKFVLQPMLDLGLNWEHPKLKKISYSIICSNRRCKRNKSHSIISPIEKLQLQQFNYIAIEGNIGAGKQLYQPNYQKIAMRN